MPGSIRIEIEGVALATRLARAERRRRLTALGLVLPLLALLIVSFVIPIATLLVGSFRTPEMGEVLPRASASLVRWDGNALPPDDVVRALIEDLVAAQREGTVGRAAQRLNDRVAGFRSLLIRTASELGATARHAGVAALLAEPDPLARLARLDSRWADPDRWSAMRQAAVPYTLFYALRAVDRTFAADGRVVAVPENRELYLAVLGRTVWICSLVTALCLLLAYPIAHLLASLPTRHGNPLLLLVLLPLWTPLLVKTLAWLIALQDTGAVNDLGIALGLWSEPLSLVRNRLGTCIAMTHILLPFMVLPLFSVMTRVDGHHLRAAAIMGAAPLRAFVRVYVPQTLPGVGVGVLLVFILALGLYVPPAFVGGPRDQMLSYFIANGDGGLSAILSLELLALVGVFMAIYGRFVGFGALWLER